MRNKLFIIIALSSLAVILLILGITIITARGGSSKTPTASSTDTSPFSPFGQNGIVPTGTTASSTNLLLDQTGQEAPVPRLRRLSDAPVSDAVVLTRAEENILVPYARFIERQTGHSNEIALSHMRTATKFTNSTLPRIQQAFWAPQGDHILVRYLNEAAETVATYLGSVETIASSTPAQDIMPTEEATASTSEKIDTVPAKLSGNFLDETTLQAVFSPDGKQIFFLVPSGGGTRGYIKNLTTGATTLLITSPLRELTATWDAKNTILLFTKPYSGAPGFAFTLDVHTKALDMVLSDVPGLLARMNPAGTQIIYFSTQDSIPVLRLYTLKDQTNKRLPLITLPEKCAWSKRNSDFIYCAVPSKIPDRTYPDKWLRGEETFSDVVWRIQLSTNTTTIVAVPPQLVGETIDAVHLTVSPLEDYLLFIDREDSTLWSTQLPFMATTSASTGTSTPSGPLF